MSYRTKPKVRKDVRYDWLKVGEGASGSSSHLPRLNGWGREIVLKPVRVDASTGTPLKGSEGKFTVNQWNTGQVHLVWLWPEQTMKTLLGLLKAGRLIGRARADVEALDKISKRKKYVTTPRPTGGEYDSQEWAENILALEAERKAQQKLRERGFSRKEAAGGTVREGGGAGDSLSGKQEPDATVGSGSVPLRETGEGGPAGGVAVSRKGKGGSVSGKAGSGKNLAGRARRTPPVRGGDRSVHV